MYFGAKLKKSLKGYAVSMKVRTTLYLFTVVWCELNENKVKVKGTLTLRTTFAHRIEPAFGSSFGEYTNVYILVGERGRVEGAARGLVCVCLCVMGG